MNIRSKI